MRNKNLLKVWIFFGVVIIIAIVLLATTFAGKRNPAQLTQEDVVALDEIVSSQKTEQEAQAIIDDAIDGGPTTLENMLSTALSPISVGSYSATTGVKGFFRRLFALREIDKEYQSLKEQIILLQTEYAFAKELQKENERLLKLLGYTEDHPQYEYVNAKIIASDPSSWFMEFTINRGARHGIATNLAVVNEFGLVGRIIEVYPTTSKVLTIIDPQSSVPVIVERSRDNGVASGARNPDSKDPEIRMNYLLSDADLIPGDQVISSSLMDVFPKGIQVGEIKEVVSEESSERYAIITPSVDFGHLENVAVVIGEVGEVQPVDSYINQREPVQEETP